MSAFELIDEPELLGPAVRCDPYPCYRRLRREAPLYRSTRYDAWIVSRYDDAVALLTHPAACHWATSDAESRFARAAARWMSLLDPRGQGQLRRLVAPIFTPRAVEAWRRPLAALAERLLDRAAETGRLDVVGAYAQPLALSAAAGLIGVPPERTDEFHVAAAGAAGRLLAVVERIETAPEAAGERPGAACIALLLELLRSVEEPPPGSLLAAVRALRASGEAADEIEMLAFLALFLFAGHENMMNFIGNAAYALAEAPDELRLLRRTPSLMPAAVRELLRYESPVQFLSIVLSEPVVLRDRRLAAGESVLICIGAANRDEARFTEPDRLDLRRPDRGSLTFGCGPFTCIGAALARLQGEVAIGALVRRLRRPAILGPLTLRRDPPVLRGFVSLELAFDA